MHIWSFISPFLCWVDALVTLHFPACKECCSEILARESFVHHAIIWTGSNPSEELLGQRVGVLKCGTLLNCPTKNPHYECVQCVGNLVSLYSCWHWILLTFKVFPKLIGKKSYFIEILICISQVSGEMNIFFMCVLAISSTYILCPFFYLFFVFLLICWDCLYSSLCLSALLSYMLEVFSISLRQLFYLSFFGVFIYTEDFTLHVVKPVVFSFLASEFRVWLRRGEHFIVYQALSFWFFPAGLGHRDSVKFIVSPL